MKSGSQPTYLRFISPLLALAMGLLVVGTALAAIGDTELVSVDSSGAQVNGNSYSPSISANGRYVAFTSEASDLVANDTNTLTDVFVYDRTTGSVERVSVDSSGNQATGGDSNAPAISADGRYVAFSSEATNLVAGDTNGVKDIFVHDRTTGITERVSVNSSGNQATGDNSDLPMISSDGRYVAFQSFAADLVASDSNGEADIFVHDRDTGVTELVSVDSSGTQGNKTSYSADLSSDGRYVAYYSYADNLVASDTNNQPDIFVHDRTTGATERVSVDSSGTQADSISTKPSISADGRYIAFRSNATNLVAGDTNGFWDIFVHDRSTGTTERVSLDDNGTQGNEDSDEPRVSADGRYIAFSSYATNLVADDTNGNPDIFVHDRTSGTTERVSVDSSGTQANDFSFHPSITSDGTYVAFESLASNLVTGDSNGFLDVFVHQYLAGAASSTASSGSTINKDIANSGTTTLQSGRIWVSVPSNAIPSGEKNCRISITEKGDSGDYGFSLDDAVWDVSIVCDSGKVSILYAPISVCIRPKDGVTTDKQVFHKHGGSDFTALASTGEKSDYVCGQTQTLSLFTLGSLAVPNTGFAPGVVTVLPEQSANAAYVASDLTLDIPTLDLHMDIVGVPQGPNGWDVSWLGNDAGYLYGTAFPTMTGNTVLTAHVWNADNTPGPFAELDQLQYGDRFTINAWGQTYTYEVRSSSLYSPNSLSPLRHEDYDWVTLITCHDFNETTGSYTLRRVVRAVLVSVD